MIRASFGSATLHISLKSTTNTTRARTTRPATTPTSDVNSASIPSSPSRARQALPLHGGDHDGAGREILHHHHPRATPDRLFGVCGVGVEGFAAAADRDHHLADAPGADVAGHSAHLPDHLLVTHVRAPHLEKTTPRGRSTVTPRVDEGDARLGPMDARCWRWCCVRCWRRARRWRPPTGFRSRGPPGPR